MSTLTSSFIAGGIAACGAVTVTHGFETVKIRCASLYSNLPNILVDDHSGCNYKANLKQKVTRRGYTEAYSTV